MSSSKWSVPLSSTTFERQVSLPTLDLVYFKAGGGHRAAALALQEALTRPGMPALNVRLVDLMEVLDPRDWFRRCTGVGPEHLYNKRLALGWTWGLSQELKVLQAAIRWAHPWLVRALQTHWEATRPHAIVSLIPNFNRALHVAARQALPGVPCLTVMTDLADHPPHFWMERGLDQTLICGTPHAVAQARTMGVPARCIHAVSGMVMRPDFHGPRLSRAEVISRRVALGLPAQGPVGLVMFGGQGSAQMLRIARGLPEVPLILLCGHNERLVQRLQAQAQRMGAAAAPRVVQGFTRDVVGFMQLADFFVGKPGPGSLSEAVQMQLPVVTFENRATMPQERYNVQWVREQGLGVVVDSVRAIPDGARALLADLPAHAERVIRQRNDAVFEVAALLAQEAVRAHARPWRPLRDRAGEDGPPLARAA
jgi:UDP-N-acetylglucosamine:LPS N-acetylglucosamine transferase